MTARPDLEEITVTLRNLPAIRKTLAAALGIAASVVSALYPSVVPWWGTAIIAGASVLGVYHVRNAPASASTRAPSPIRPGSAPGSPGSTGAGWR